MSDATELITCEQCGKVFEYGDTDACARYDFCSQACEDKYWEDHPDLPNAPR